MRGWILLLVLAIPGASACQVTPMLEFHLDEAPRCTPFDRDACDDAPAPMDPRVYDGAIRWYWDVDECTTQGGLMQDEMQITFSGSAANPAWLGLSFDPDVVTVPMHEYYDPTSAHYENDRLYSEKEEAFQVRVDFLRMPVDEERDRIEQRDGLVPVYLKAQAKGEGARDAFAIRQLGFEGGHLLASAPLGQDRAPQEEASMPVLLPLIGLLGVAVLRHRRAV